MCGLDYEDSTMPEFQNVTAQPFRAYKGIKTALESRGFCVLKYARVHHFPGLLAS